MTKLTDTEPPHVWKSVGRGTPAGRALFNLFSDDVNGKQTGDKFSARNKAVLEAKIAMGWRPSVPGTADHTFCLWNRAVLNVNSNCFATREVQACSAEGSKAV